MLLDILGVTLKSHSLKTLVKKQLSSSGTYKNTSRIIKVSFFPPDFFLEWPIYKQIRSVWTIGPLTLLLNTC